MGRRKSRLYGNLHCLQPVIVGILLGLKCRILRDGSREKSLAQVSCVMLYVYVVPPTLVGWWLMALVLRQSIEYNYKLMILQGYGDMCSLPEAVCCCSQSYILLLQDLVASVGFTLHV